MPLDPARPRDAVIAAGRERLLAHAIDGLRSQLNASALSEDLPLSRDTAYRVFRDDGDESVSDAIIRAVAEAANDTSWGGADAALADALAAYQASVEQGSDARVNLAEGLRAAFEAQFRSPGQPVGWILQASALTASPAWKGDPPATDDLDVAQRILDIRRAHYQALTEQLTWLVVGVMSELGRRPRAGLDPRAVVVLVHCLLDGAVLRRFIEPDAMPPELFAEAMLLLYDALSEPGSFDDPRRPDDERNQQVFDRVVAAAAELWGEGPDVTVDDAAERAGVSPEAATLLFPGVGDLADSLVRARVVAGGFTYPGPAPDQPSARRYLPVLVAELARLRDLADKLPHAVAALQAHPPTRSQRFVDDFIDHESRVVAALGTATDPEQFVHDLFTFACQGTPGWPSVVALLRTIGYDH
ncbi:MAG TPA: hypothetical protein VIL48_14750 [Acidimicrobiales bacterium]